MFHEQDWVQHKQMIKNGFVDHVGDSYLKVYYVDGSIGTIRNQYFIPLPFYLDNSQIYMLMSHAVDMGDRKWFEELRQRLNTETEAV